MDDKLSVHQKHPSHGNKAANKKNRKQRQPFKVVYISNPLKVTLTADNFRARVQELTGRDSNVAEFSDTNRHASPVAAAAAAAAVGLSHDSNRLRDECSFGAVAPPYDQMFGEAFGAPDVPCNFTGLFYEAHIEGGFSQHG